MFDNQVTRQQYGNVNLRDTDILSDQPIQDSSLYHQYYNDFDDYVAANWTVTQIGAGTAPALAAGDGGIITMITGATAKNSISNQKLFPSFSTQLGVRFWGRIVFSVDSLLANVIIGKTNSTTTPYTGGQITDGVYLTTTGGTGVVKFNVAASGTITTVTTTTSLVAGLGNYCRFSWYWDGGIYAAAPSGRVVCQVDGWPTLGGSGVTAPARAEFGGSSANALPAGYPTATNTTMQFDVQANTAAARTMNVDMIQFTKERYNILTTPPVGL